MKIIKCICLEILLFISLLILGIVTLKIMDIIFKINFDNIWQDGFKVGFLAWIIVLVSQLFIKYKGKK